MLRADADSDESSGEVLDSRDAGNGFHLPGRLEGTGVVEDVFERLDRKRVV